LERFPIPYDSCTLADFALPISACRDRFGVPDALHSEGRLGFDESLTKSGGDTAGKGNATILATANHAISAVVKAWWESDLRFDFDDRD
jgi:hypothetical protein